MATKNDSLSFVDFDRLRSLILAECGISMTTDKKIMLEIRLRRRLISLQVSSYAEYCELVFSGTNGRQELVHMIDCVTTNKTDFFRQPDHFEYLATKALPDLDARKGADRSSLVWSAGCSTGEEPYTLAMVLSEYAEGRAGFRFGVLASDICTTVLAKARVGVFNSEVVKPVPPDLRRKYLMRSRDPSSGQLRVVPELRAKIEFRRINFMDANLGLAESPEIIFCRNVIIYFDRLTQIRVLENLTNELVPGGYFFAGHSEFLHSMSLPLVAVAPAVYRKCE
jgi:chemotaxis protein methyltransferase CheR